MTNLVPIVDTSEYYNVDIERIYKFKTCEINNPNYLLKYSEVIENSRTIYIYLLTDLNENHLSIIKLTEYEIGNKVYHQINKSFSLQPGKGYGRILYELIFIFHNYSIISDCINTLPGSYNVWRKFLSIETATFFNLDLKNGRSTRIYKD